MVKSLFGGLFPSEVEILIMEFDPSIREAWDIVTGQLIQSEKWLDIQSDLYPECEHTNYPWGEGRGSPDPNDGTMWIYTYRYYNHTSRQMVPEHEVQLNMDGTKEIWHFIEGMPPIRGRAGDHLAILES